MLLGFISIIYQEATYCDLISSRWFIFLCRGQPGAQRLIVYISFFYGDHAEEGVLIVFLECQHILHLAFGHGTNPYQEFPYPFLLFQLFHLNSLSIKYRIYFRGCKKANFGKKVFHLYKNVSRLWKPCRHRPGQHAHSDLRLSAV